MQRRNALAARPCRLIAIALVATVLSACGSAPPQRETAGSASDRVAAVAADAAAGQVGRPYRYGGTSPSGFDCSGLVHFSYRRAGFTTPRTTQQLWRNSVSVDEDELRRGDLLFFDQDGQKSSHVGIWLGGGRFVHAPSSGGRVRVDRLESDYWQRHFVGGRRL